MVDFENVTDSDYETRASDVKRAAKTAEGLKGKVTVPKVWNDDMPQQEPSTPLQPLTWCVAMKRAAERLISAGKSSETT